MGFFRGLAKEPKQMIWANPGHGRPAGEMGGESASTSTATFGPGGERTGILLLQYI